MEKSGMKLWTQYLILYGMVVLTLGQRRRPNIILLITDDQDTMLNSMQVMEQTRQYITEQGVEFTNAFTTTPMCCPSRSSILTGLYTHNHHVYTNNDNCSSVLWQRSHETRSYATYLNKSGYHTGYFGKYLNEYNGSYTPPGWDYWMGLIKNSKYYNYTLLHNGNKESHGNDYSRDYFTDLVTNRSIDFFRSSKAEDRERPVLTVVSYPAPHGPEDSAPQYQDLYPDPVSHITKAFDYLPNPDKHWIMRQRTIGMDKDQLHFSKLLQQKRLQTLRSVDDSVKKIFDMLQETNELENTYVLYSSDHGYHIGQFGIAKGKSMPYDFDIRIPFLMRGPNIPRNVKSKKIALNIDIAPTILDIAGVQIPPEMDGRSLLEIFERRNNNVRPWRDSFLVERLKRHWNRTHLSRPKMAKETKLEKLKKLCQLENYVNPCRVGQDWTCLQESDGKSRLQKCKKEKKPPKPRKRFNNNPHYRRQKLCPCPRNPNLFNSIDSDSDEVNVLQTCGKGLMSSGYRNQRGGSRKLNNRNSYRKHMQNIQEKVGQSYNNLRKNKQLNRRRIKRSAEKNSPKNYTSSKSIVLTSSCRLYMPNFEIRCLENLYNDPREWMNHMGHLAKSVKTLQFKMKYMKMLRSCLNAYDEMTKSANLQMCKCPVAPPAPKPSKIKSETHDNATHPLTDFAAQLNKKFTEEQREYYERRETVRMMKEMRLAKLNRIAKREKLGKLRLRKCGKEGVTCFKLTRSTWATEPKWDRDEQCYCTNSNNNTYWCVRIINEDTNMMFCQFITGFIEYFQMNRDADQLVNREMYLDKVQQDVFLDMIESYKGCKGADDCTLEPFNKRVVDDVPDDDVDDANMDVDMNAPQGRSFQPSNTTLIEDPVNQLSALDIDLEEDGDDDEIQVNLDRISTPKRGKNKARQGQGKHWDKVGQAKKYPRKQRQSGRKGRKYIKRHWNYKYHPGHRLQNKYKSGKMRRGKDTTGVEFGIKGSKKIHDQRKEEKTRYFRNKRFKF